MDVFFFAELVFFLPELLFELLDVAVCLAEDDAGFFFGVLAVALASFFPLFLASFAAGFAFEIDNLDGAFFLDVPS
ncbi:MAG: hypothetical protein CSA70_11010 [Rhodobacterales bacterium]|nr:MAG: hypothetical protein CSA70_11010 [Rhodobacterales bacterium]